MVKVILNYSAPSIEYICALKIVSAIVGSGFEVQVFCDVGWLSRDFNFKPMSEIKIGPFDVVLRFNVSNKSRLFFMKLGKSNLLLGRRNFHKRLLIYLSKFFKNIVSFFFGYSRLDLSLPRIQTDVVESQVYSNLKNDFVGDFYISDINPGWRKNELDIFANSTEVFVFSAITCPAAFRGEFATIPFDKKKFRYLGFPFYKIDFHSLDFPKSHFTDEVIKCLYLLMSNRGKSIAV